MSDDDNGDGDNGDDCDIVTGMNHIYVEGKGKAKPHMCMRKNNGSLSDEYEGEMRRGRNDREE